MSKCIIYVFVFIVFPSFLILFSLQSHLTFLALFLFLRWCTGRVLFFSQSPYLRSGICEGKFWHWYCETLSFSVENQRVSSFPPRQVEFDFFNFLTVIGVKFVKFFSIMKGDKFVTGALLDSMIMNQGKGVSVSLSEECDSFKLCLNFCLRKKPYLLYIFHWSYVPPSTAESNLKREWIKGETYSPWLRQGYNTSIFVLRAWFRTSAKFWFL